LSALAILLIPLVAWLAVLLRAVVRRRRWLHAIQVPLVYTSVELEWQFEENGDFSSTGVYTLENVGKEPLDELPTDDFLWAVEPSEARMRVRIIDDGGKNHSIVEYENSVYRRVLAYLTKGDSYVIAFSHRIVPPLAPGESMRLEMQIETPGTESDAFTEAGTVLGVPANIPTRHANLICVGPVGYRFEVLKGRWVVESTTGENVPEEEARIEPPLVSPAGTTLTWQLSDLRQGLRYWIHYRFRREDMLDIAPGVRGSHGD
jgi:hypothetical protein